MLFTVNAFNISYSAHILLRRIELRKLIEAQNLQTISKAPNISKITKIAVPITKTIVR